MSIFKTEVDPKIVTSSDTVCRSEMEFNDAQNQHLPGFMTTREMDVKNLESGAIRRKGDNNG